MKPKNPAQTLLALRVHQWLPAWESVPFDDGARRRRPEPSFYVLSISANQLRTLSGIYRRETAELRPRTQDLGIQRRHDEGRSKEIGEYLRFGYPLSAASPRQRGHATFKDLQKPGWLPTAIVVNILGPADERLGKTVSPDDLMTIEKSDLGTEVVRIALPISLSGPLWRPSTIHPIEIIDGQHRLWSFDSSRVSDDFQLPVVAFHALDLSWQAYLFWTINIKPKRINTSLAFDLYPLLRTEDWLERFEGPSVYRETRAQELTETLWSHPQSPWHNRINMLGEPGQRGHMVSQAGWIRSLLATYIKSFEGRGITIGGLFGAPVGADNLALPWSRSEQAAFLIVVWNELKDAIAKTEAQWAKRLRQTHAGNAKGDDLAFSGMHTLLSTDQGVRAVLAVTNDLCYLEADALKLSALVFGDQDVGPTDTESVQAALAKFKQTSVRKFLSVIASALTAYDWRSASAPGLTPEQRTDKLAFRGSGGYRELRRQLLHQVAKSGSGAPSAAARAALSKLGYE
jgi:DGQHR domain-containing protein